MARIFSSHGWIFSVLGVEVANLLHGVAAAFGLSALLMSSAMAFSVVKYLGAAYLIYLGVHKLLIREELSQPKVVERKKLARIFYQGVQVRRTSLPCEAPRTSLTRRRDYATARRGRNL